jgi:hypothetical protein
MCADRTAIAHPPDPSGGYIGAADRPVEPLSFEFDHLGDNANDGSAHIN